jgi:hypothetical protein
MPFIAECQFCRRKVRAPDHAVGSSISCPDCGSYFTLLPTGHAAAAHTADAPAGQRRRRSAAVTPGLLEREDPSGAPTDDESPPSSAPTGGSRLNPVAVAALFLGGLALLFASLPGLDLLTLPCGGLGLILGLAGTLRARASGRGLFLSAAGAGLSAAVLLVACLWPGVFNPLKGHRADTAGQESKQPRVVPVGRAVARRESAPVEEGAWVDASQDAVQVGDLRVRVLAAAVRTVSFKDPARARAARERPLLITLRIYNLGTGRRIAYTSWGEPSAGREDELARLSDHTGRTYRLKSFGAGVEVVGRTARASLTPGKYVDDVLIFEPPPAPSVVSLRLELPGSAGGAADTLRLQLPGSMVQYR